MAKLRTSEELIPKKCDACTHICEVGEPRFYFEVFQGSGYVSPTNEPYEEINGMRKFTLCKTCYNELLESYPKFKEINDSCMFIWMETE